VKKKEVAKVSVTDCVTDWLTSDCNRYSCKDTKTCMTDNQERANDKQTDLPHPTPKQQRPNNNMWQPASCTGMAATDGLVRESGERGTRVESHKSCAAWEMESENSLRTRFFLKFFIQIRRKQKKIPIMVVPLFFSYVFDTDT
jgi:hypothetical protein